MVSGSGPGELPVWDAVGCLTAAVEGLAGAGLWRCGDAELLDLQQVVETAVRRLSAASLRLVAEVDDRRLATARGATGTAALLRQLLNISAGEAGWRVTAAEKLLDRTSPSGAVVPAALPATGAALADGAIEAGQARVICETIRRLPAAGGRRHPRARGGVPGRAGPGGGHDHPGPDRPPAGRHPGPGRGGAR